MRLWKHGKQEEKDFTDKQVRIQFLRKIIFYEETNRSSLMIFESVLYNNAYLSGIIRFYHSMC